MLCAILGQRCFLFLTGLHDFNNTWSSIRGENVAEWIQFLTCFRHLRRWIPLRLKQVSFFAIFSDFQLVEYWVECCSDGISLNTPTTMWLTIIPPHFIIWGEFHCPILSSPIVVPFPNCSRENSTTLCWCTGNCWCGNMNKSLCFFRCWKMCSALAFF